MRGLVLVAVCLMPLSAAAQWFSGASITGTILCGDTNTPARFARVSLKSVSLDVASSVASQQVQQMQQRAAKTTVPNPHPISQTDWDRQRSSLTRSIYNSQERSTASSADVNGHYKLTGIQPGTYVVQVDMPGYIDPVTQFSFQDITSSDANVLAQIARSVPVVTIAGTEEQRLDLRLQRGASVAGRVLFDDGAPAMGWNISVIPTAKLGKKEDPNASTAQMATPLLVAINGVVPSVQGIAAFPVRSDDLGNFRVSGLPAGDYVVRAQLLAIEPGHSGQGPPQRLTVYSGDALHATDAKPFTLASGQARYGEDLTVKLHALHNIRGKVTAQADSHTITGGSISVTGKDDPTVTASASINADGSYEIYSLPAGEYKVSVTQAFDIQTVTPSTDNYLGRAQISDQITDRFGPASTSVVIGDTDASGVDFAVPDQ